MLYEIDWHSPSTSYPSIIESRNGVDLKTATLMLIRYHILVAMDHAKEVERLLNAISIQG